MTCIGLVSIRHHCDQLASHLSVLAQVGPHAGPVPPAHQHMVGEEVDPGHVAGELPGVRVVVFPQVCDHVVKLQHLVPLVRVLQADVERDPVSVGGGVRALRLSVLGTCGPGHRGEGESAVAAQPWRSPRTRRSGLSRRAPGSGFARSPRLPATPLRHGRLRSDAVHVLDHLYGAGAARFRGVRVADHPTGAHHLVVARGGLGGCAQQKQRDGDGQSQQNHRDGGHQEDRPPAGQQETRAAALGGNFGG